MDHASSSDVRPEIVYIGKDGEAFADLAQRHGSTPIIRLSSGWRGWVVPRLNIGLVVTVDEAVCRARLSDIGRGVNWATRKACGRVDWYQSVSDHDAACFASRSEAVGFTSRHRAQWPRV